jgi:Predicted membrane protein (DUF2254)
MVSDRSRWRRSLFGTITLLAGIAVILFGAFWLLDFYWLHGGGAGPGPLARLVAFDPDTLQNALGNLAQIIAAVLGIAITVVSIVVQLAATRYTPRVADMFFRDRTNLTVMGFFVVACINAVWVSVSVSRDYVPVATVAFTVGLATASLLALMPYFAYVFDFLNPEAIVARIGQQTLEKALGGARRARDPIAIRQGQTVTSMEQLADVAVNALTQKDKVIASNAVGALRRVIVEYLPAKPTLPAAWFAIGPALRGNPDLVALAPDSVADLVSTRTWLEWKGLKQMRGVFGEALKAMPELAHVVAIETRYVGEAALAAADQAVLALAVKFMNTYLRGALNARDVGTAYNVLNQYRQLSEAVLRSPEAAGSADGGVGEIAVYFKYYAQLAHGVGLGFITETAAYDLSALCELANELGSPLHDRLLGTLLEIDKQAENSAQERALRGVRKAQAKLAAYYLLRGLPARARQIYDDMALESGERLRSIRDEMLAITTKDFWEIIDRGTNFDYVDEGRKAKLREFFDWFLELKDGALDDARDRAAAPAVGGLEPVGGSS